ncbi:MAG: Asp-tRNA(Asn)/Glu-tRNA(Gln) amidotransferase subunit GatC [Gammaproteobacteria bacterium]|nr:MAG: Asp-tRNA(Asn)/Glu-tRNA(Gln) amidotransferase subunit GatC [Gammaproteobacteria bacterium]
MSLGPEEVRRIAWLARLEISEADIDGYARNLSDILDFVEQLADVPTDGVEPMAHPLDATQRLRPDEVTETNQRDRFLALAPAAENGLFLVPRVIE